MNKHMITLADKTKILALGQGTWSMGDTPAAKSIEIKALQTGIDLGMNIIDTAELYGEGRSEKLVGEAISGRRSDVYLISKVLPSNASRKGTLSSCEKSLKRLKTDYLDLYLLHWQGRHPFEDTVEAMLQLVEEGKIKSWGVSNMDVEEMEDFFSINGGNTCVANQVLYNVSRRGIEYDLIPWCNKNKVSIIAYSPIEQGRLIKNKVLKQIAEKHSATIAQIALAWVLRQPGMIAIPKAGTPEHVKENYESLKINLNKDDLNVLDQAFPAPTRKKSLEML